MSSHYYLQNLQACHIDCSFDFQLEQVMQSSEAQNIFKDTSFCVDLNT